MCSLDDIVSVCSAALYGGGGGETSCTLSRLWDSERTTLSTQFAFNKNVPGCLSFVFGRHTPVRAETDYNTTPCPSRTYNTIVYQAHVPPCHRWSLHPRVLQAWRQREGSAWKAETALSVTKRKHAVGHFVERYYKLEKTTHTTQNFSRQVMVCWFVQKIR